jgi:tetratricopeptide (TPR) repeat protein
MALFNKGVTLGTLGRGEAALAIYDAVVERYGAATEAALREAVAMALVNKGVTLGALGRSAEELGVYDDVVQRYGAATEPTLREQIAAALVNKGVTLGALGSYEEAEVALRQAIGLDMGGASLRAWSNLGSLLVDKRGDLAGALAAFETGVSIAVKIGPEPLLHANYAYALALHAGDPARATEHVRQALADGTSISTAGRHLLEALPGLADASANRWGHLFDQIGKAVASEDAALWSDYLDDLQRLLSFAIAQGQGEALRGWMEEAQYAVRYAPLYHAVVAAVDGDDHLLKINPETRQPAERIYEGIARRLTLYPGAGTNSSRKRRG